MGVVESVSVQLMPAQTLRILYEEHHCHKYQANHLTDSRCIGLESLKMESCTAIQGFYSGKTVLITGGTGYLGQVLVEKLLRTCQDVKEIYMVVRKRRDKTAMQRIDEYFNKPVFSRMKDANPNYRSKLVGLVGDFSAPGLGLSDDDRKTLAEKVNVVFHAASTVYFKETLSFATITNLRGTKLLLDLCKTMPNLVAFIYVSSVYSCSYRDVVEEKVYDFPETIDWQSLLKLVEVIREEDLVYLTKKFLGKSPNTYTFTKAMVEMMLQESKENVPVAIFRPGIILSTAFEPFPGFVENTSSFCTIYGGISLGIIRLLVLDGNKHCTHVPGDMCVNAMLASAWDTATVYAATKTTLRDHPPPVYNYTMPNGAYTWGKYAQATRATYTMYPVTACMWHPSLGHIAHKPLAAVAQFLLHLLPAHCADIVRRIRGQPPKMVKRMRKLQTELNAVDFFCTTDWNFDSKNVNGMWEKMSPQDQELFNFNLRELDLDPYFANSFKAMREVVFREGLDTVPAAKQRAKRLFWIHYTLMAGLCLIVALFAWFITIY